MKRTPTVVLNPLQIQSIEISFDPTDHLPNEMVATDSRGRQFPTGNIEHHDVKTTPFGEMNAMTGHFGEKLKVVVLMAKEVSS